MARQQIAMESFHSETVSGWQGSHPTAREPCHGEIVVFTSDRFLCSQVTEPVVEQRSIGQMFDDRVKLELGNAV